MSVRHNGGRNYPENLAGGLGNKYFHEADYLHLSYTTSTAPHWIFLLEGRSIPPYTLCDTTLAAPTS
jgi:hypothetical protein